MKKLILPYIVVILLGLSIFNVWFFKITYQTAKSEYYKTPKEIIITKYIEREFECVCPECKCDWTDRVALPAE